MSISRPQQLGRDPLKASLSRARCRLVVRRLAAQLRPPYISPVFLILFYESHDFNPSTGPTTGSLGDFLLSRGQKSDGLPFFLPRKEEKRREKNHLISLERSGSSLRKKGESSITVQGLASCWNSLFLWRVCDFVYIFFPSFSFFPIS